MPCLSADHALVLKVTVVTPCTFIFGIEPPAQFFVLLHFVTLVRLVHSTLRGNFERGSGLVRRLLLSLHEMDLLCILIYQIPWTLWVFLFDSAEMFVISIHMTPIIDLGDVLDVGLVFQELS